MNLFNKKIRISLIMSILLLMVLLIIGFICFFNNTVVNTKLNTLAGGLLTGFIIAFFQLLLSWYEYREIDKFKRMYVVDIKSNRDDRQFYENLIRNSKEKIDIMGVTATRFINHFADLASSRESTKVLLTAMSNGIKVRILIPDIKFLEDKRQMDDAKHTHEIFEKIKQKFNNMLEFKYFKHVATHSIFIVDDLCIIGPVFPGISSKDTPAILIKKNSPYAEKYIQYFEQEWNKL